MKSVYKNWFVHNMFAHPLMQLLSMVGCTRLGEAIHDCTVPNSD